MGAAGKRVREGTPGEAERGVGHPAGVCHQHRGPGAALARELAETHWIFLYIVYRLVGKGFWSKEVWISKNDLNLFFES